MSKDKLLKDYFYSSCWFHGRLGNNAKFGHFYSSPYFSKFKVWIEHEFDVLWHIESLVQLV